MFARVLPSCLALAWLAGAVPAAAAESPAVRSPRATATLVTDTDAAAPGVAFQAGLRLRLAPGWHVYWRNPGAAGVATAVTPALPGGAAAGPVQWPAPERLTEAGITVYGYTGEVVLPFTVTPGVQSGGGFHLSAAASWLVCQSVCVPEEGSFDLDLPWGTPAPSAAAPALAAALARVPGPARFAAALSPSGVLTLSGNGLAGDGLAGDGLAGVRGATFFPDAPDTVADGADQPFSVADGAVRLRLTPGPAFRPGAVAGVVELREADGAVRAAAVTPGAGPEPVGGEDAPGLLPTLVLAVAGGLLLNLMPCVFPILAMKAAGLARLGGAGRRAVRLEALAYTAGVLTTFCGLGGGLAAAGGGWGAQFQSPAFVAGAAWLLFAVGLNLSGVWTAGVWAGDAWAGRGGAAGAFATGALAVAVAAPCTAPFMGTAMAAALTLPGAAALAVFAAMGAGLAAPYLLLAAWPGLARALPRPGRWMEVLKGALAFPMYAASAWLVWVVSTEAGASGVLAAGAGLVLVGFAAWVWTAAAGAGRRGRRVGWALSGLSVLLAAALLPEVDAGPGADVARAEPFSAERLAALRADGRPVFVDMTASWCIPCLLNERVALSPAAVQQAFANGHVAVLRGDWTRKDPAITAFLRSQDRAGVPLYVFYPPGGGPVVMPQVLTEGMVLDQIARGSGRS